MLSAMVLSAVLVQPLTGLENAVRWSSDDANLYPVATVRGRLEIGVKGSAADGVRRVSLKDPIPVPAGADLHFKILRPKWQSLFLKAVVRDAEGQEFAVWTSGRYHLAKSNAFGGQFRMLNHRNSPPGRLLVSHDLSSDETPATGGRQRFALTSRRSGTKLCHRLRLASR